MCGHTERDAGDFFQEDRSVRRAVGEVNVKMIDSIAREKVREIERIARTLLGLDLVPVFPLVPIYELLGPFAGCFRILLPNSQDFLRWRVTDRGAELGDMFVTQTREWRVNRANLEGDTKPFQRQHLSIAKSLGNNRITGIEITESHRDR